MKSLNCFITEKMNLSKELIDIFNILVSSIIEKNNIDMESIDKLIKSHDYNTEDIFYNLEFPTTWKDNKKGYSELKFLIENMYQEFEDNSKYKNIDWNEFWNYFKENICDILK